MEDAQLRELRAASEKLHAEVGALKAEHRSASAAAAEANAASLRSFARRPLVETADGDRIAAMQMISP